MYSVPQASQISGKKVNEKKSGGFSWCISSDSTISYPTGNFHKLKNKTVEIQPETYLKCIKTARPKLNAIKLNV